MTYVITGYNGFSYFYRERQLTDVIHNKYQKELNKLFIIQYFIKNGLQYI